jgi:predicted 3-demethylubiquinone-9 3-methyltransferase (glyoxalase superfamily)
VSWQIVPSEFIRMMETGDAQQKERVFGAMMQMKKLDVAALRSAFEGR